MLAADAWNERDEATREREAVRYEMRVYDTVYPKDHFWHPVLRRQMEPILSQAFGKIMVGRAFEVLLGGGGVGVDGLQFRVTQGSVTT